MGSTLCGLLLLSVAPNFTVLLIAAALVGTGSSVFHPEASRVARMASGGRHGLAQSLFQVGGNAGSAMGPLLAAWIIIPGGRQHCLVHDCRVAGHRGVAPDRSLVSASAIAGQTKPKKKSASYVPLPRKTVIKAVSVLLILIFSKYFYMASLSSYFTFYLISKFNLSVQDAQIHLFIFLFAVAVGTVAGGPIGDRFGRKLVIWVSILGVAPFTLMLPHANLFWTSVLTVIIGVILASAFSAILVFAQELMPGKVGTVSGLFFGFAFGMGGIGAALLGKLADMTDIYFVYQVCAFLPLIGLLAAFLPKLEKAEPKTA